uniref:PspC domain-containing protein n=1 Tax=Nocardioides sp. TaxID=35761 RepID=UPI003569F5B0
MTSTPPPPPPNAPAPGNEPDTATEPPPHRGPRRTAAEIRDLTRLRRSVSDRRIAGVAGGIARHLDIDPVIVRVTLVVLIFFGGAGLILYAALWLLLPREGTDDRPLGLDDANRSVAVIIAGVLAALALLGDSWGAFWFPWPLAIIALVVVLLLNRRDRSRAPGTAAGPRAVAPTGTAYAAAPPPVTDRHRGPLLFWFTLALIALGIGVLGVVDLAGVAVPHAGYPALALALTALMLVLGAFYGRAGGLVLLGLVLTVALVVTSAVGRWDNTRLTVTPMSPASVASSYEFSTGELVLDLSRVDDPEGLDGRTITLTGTAGRLAVVVPSGWTVRVDARVRGAGEIRLFGETSDGVDVAVARDRLG